MPSPLPPEPPIRLEGELQALLSSADRALGRLDGSIQTRPHPNLGVAMYVREEAVLSSQIEGTQSSLQDVLAAEARVLSVDRPSDVDEVFNYVAAMNHVAQFVGNGVLQEMTGQKRNRRLVYRDDVDLFYDASERAAPR